MIKLTNPKSYKIHDWVIYCGNRKEILDSWDSEALARQALPEWYEVAKAQLVQRDRVEVVEVVEGEYEIGFTRVGNLTQYKEAQENKVTVYTDTPVGKTARWIIYDKRNGKFLRAYTSKPTKSYLTAVAAVEGMAYEYLAIEQAENVNLVSTDEE